MLKEELENIFELNEMQKEAYKNQGKNLVFNAPTGSGKTEAVLLSIPEGKTVSFLLPTITSSIFMYRRLKENGFFNLDLKTSILKEIETVRRPALNIEIHTPDAPLLDYMKTGKQTLNDVVVMDELDNYPPMVKTVLIDYIKNNPKTQFLVASATLDNNLKEAFKDFEKIEYNTDIDLLKFKTEEFYSNDYPDDEDYENFADILNNVPKDGKIGFIFNCIDNMENFADTYSKIFYDENGELKNGVIMHHSNVDVDTRNKNEEKLFNGDYKICISNDIISYSVDISFDTMFMEPSDRTATNIQRLGRCNRYNKEIGGRTNLYIMPDLYTPPFMDGWDKREEHEKFSDQKFYYTDIEKMREKLPLEPIPSLEKVNNFIRNRIKMGLEPSLREIPVTFEITKEVKEYNPKTKSEEKVIKKFHIKPIGDELPYAEYPVRPVMDERGQIQELKKDLVHIQKRRVCDDYFIMLDNKVPVKTERIGEEKYDQIKMDEEALNFSIEDLNKLKTFTDSATDVYNEIESKLDKFEISDEKKENLKQEFFTTFLNEVVEEKIQDNKINRIHQILENKLDEFIEEWRKVPFEKISNFTQTFNDLIYYGKIESENKEKNSFLGKAKDYKKYIQSDNFKEELNSFIKNNLISKYGKLPEKKKEKINGNEKKMNKVR